MAISRWVIAGCIGLLVFASVAIYALVANKRLEYVDLPADDDVKDMVARVYKLHGWPAVPEFRIPARYIGTIMSAIRPAVKLKPSAWDPHLADQLAEIVISCKSSKNIQIILYDTGDGPCIFSLDGVLCGRAGKRMPSSISAKYGRSYSPVAVVLRDIIKEIYDERDNETMSDRLRRDIDDLRRSIGEIPPLRD